MSNEYHDSCSLLKVPNMFFRYATLMLCIYSAIGDSLSLHLEVIYEGDVRESFNCPHGSVQC